jgi:predicted porin
VAGAIFAAASAAQAGIIIPAGDWTLDINGNVNAFTNFTHVDKNETITGSVTAVGRDTNNKGAAKGINTGLLPSWLGFTGKTRQNDLDVEFTISLQPSASENSYHGDGSNGIVGASVNQTSLNRQTYVSFGDKSWGSIKLGKDLGIYAAEAILNDMTLLGVGAGAGASGAAGNTTLGGIGTGYQYAAWKGQVAYTTPNFNGFQATVGIVNPNMFPVQQAGINVDDTNNTITLANTYQSRFGYEGKASYTFAANDVTGKVWVSGASYDVTASAANGGWDTTIYAADIGATVNAGGFGLTGYYYGGEGNGITALGLNGMTATGKKRDGDGGYVQATYVLPTKTKLGIAFGQSNLDLGQGDAAAASNNLIDSQRRITVGAYHPLTKHLNVVAEFNDVKNEAHNNAKNEYQSGSLGAILFF